MRRLLLSTTALILLSTPVFADPPDRGGRGEGRGHAEQAAPQHGGPGDADRGGGRGFDRGRDRGPAPQAMQAPPQRNFDRDHGPGRQAAIEQNRDQMHDQMRGDRNRGDWRARPQASLQSSAPQFQREDRDRDYRRAFNDNRNDNRDRNAARPGLNRDFNRDGRTDYRAQRFNGPRHDFSGFRDFHRNFQASRHFRGPEYRRPAGWYSHRWAFGEFLPAAFWARDYWLIDFVDYDLPPPPYGAVWVRVDRDALLIDEDSGEIITVAYDVFY